MRFVSRAFVAAIVLTSSAFAAEATWLTSYTDALAKAKEQNKPVLADFTGSDWCGWCKKLKAEVFDTDEFKAWAEKNVVLLELDFPRSIEQPAELKGQNSGLQERFKVKGFPTVIFLDAEGKELARTGYVKGGPKAWIAEAEGKLKGQAPAAESQWITSYDEAVKRAKKEKKLILADFTGSDWCGWCKKLKAEVFETEEFKAWAEANVILLEIDFPKGFKLSEELTKQNEELGQKYAVRGYPTILFLDAKGAKKGEMGYLEGGPKKWIEQAAKIAGNKKPKKKAPAKEA